MAPPISPEYLFPLYGIIVTSIVGWSIPSIIGWLKAINHRRRLHEFHIRIAELCKKDGKLDQKHIESLDMLRRDVTDAYAKGKISEQQYGNLKNEISILYEEMYNKKIDGELGLTNGKLLESIKNDITDAYAKGKISDLHFNLLNEKISKAVDDTTSKTTGDIKVVKRSPI